MKIGRVVGTVSVIADIFFFFFFEWILTARGKWELSLRSTHEPTDISQFLAFPNYFLLVSVSVIIIVLIFWHVGLNIINTCCVRLMIPIIMIERKAGLSKRKNSKNGVNGGVWISVEQTLTKCWLSFIVEMRL